MAVAVPFDHSNAAVHPEVRRLGMDDLAASLREGWSDFLAIPTQLVFFCIFYPVFGLLAARYADDGRLLPLLFPLAAGLALVGPLLAVGMYELSRRRDAGRASSWLNAFGAFRSPAILSIAGLGVGLLVLFALWIAAARAIFDATIGPVGMSSVGELASAVRASPNGAWLFVAGNLVGAAFAAVALTVSVVSFPMLLDRDCGVAVAVQTSMRAVRRNPVVMAAWGVIVAALIAAGSLVFFVGLAVVMPVLGHATWRLYRRTVV